MSEPLPHNAPIMAMARFNEIITEHQTMSQAIELLCDIFQVKSKKDRLNTLIHYAKQADAAFQFLPEGRAWLRAISLEFPETKSRVNEALADFENFGAGLTKAGAGNPQCDG